MTLSTGPIRFAILSTDIVVFTVRDTTLYVRLMRTHRPPHFMNTPALPGGLLNPDETAEEAARRIVGNKVGIDGTSIYMEQLYTFSRVDRDPRGRVVAVAHIALVPWDNLSPTEQQDSDDTWWSPVKDARKLAYDHDEILALAIRRLQSRISYTTVGMHVLPKEFTLTELESVYSSILGTSLDKRNFRKKILKIGILKPSAHKRAGGRFRPAQLYRFGSKRVIEVGVV